MKTANIAKTLTFAVAAAAVALGLAAPAGAAASQLTYGDPTAAAQFWRQQQYDDCVLMSSADVIGEITGAQPSEHDIIEKAQSTPSVAHPGPIYTKPAASSNPEAGPGANTADIPELLAQYRIGAVAGDKDDAAQTGTPSGMVGLERALAAGHKVIVSLNAELIWHQPVEQKDKNGRPESNHAVVVTGVDTVAGMVHLNDSGIPEGRNEQIPIQLFVESWGTSNELMVVTT
ncbi:hypothetical protein A5621_21455 [Mycobacterium colombiense]|uniref:hypothetical protein n=1 Tax=Mycobacterium colombiense TaxID=339268 RepID=UPI0007EC7DC9|nr:hypothetical protein [Mycobacterium colombiense]OBJ23597.1 hypothetical protein A9W93_11105 [Mycobacterium colombiense]OBJ27203.1 hypothetical protein A5620_04885 [Mycobacterium colombiense]OBJ31791.1 hypothetical protein A5621_21455 [Mycobacterium colombiense]OBJ69506.1 hypothetical protein A5627_25105 [Mycobacterium colombiense]